ncbi:helix-turn-helix domain-containing protein [Clostridium neonatale]|uniref:DNA-binding protein n=1 Tax=Clostridium neonatale TaxID=137838 RepID=A0AA86JU59_9CLOT|nr:helix-turn-helix transcriptional regulator [Clostridium neonatale]CAG9703670.1 DNA-binding protein [Clostridium neonatale]CAI3539156.1 conserved hypothetical protein [Clostridium neonatale]CAI3540052.1 conserved hypothetical protein [Clostridium neonatale]CAI3545638.1 conserved hypothetical protein [Clostridium neonatale]CAI3552219.1 conserved hypothetical protein [Clostridium neonatale]
MGLEIINKLKKEKGLTNEALSLQSGVPLGTLSKITSGITKDPKLETLKALAKVLGCTLDDFDDTNTSQNNIDVKEAQLVENYKKLNSIAKNKLVEYSNDLIQIPKYIENDNKVVDYTKLLSKQDKYKDLDNSTNEISATKEDDEFAISRNKALEARKKKEQYFKEKPHLIPKASHDKEGNFTEEDYKHDDDLMMNDDLWND